MGICGNSAKLTFKSTADLKDWMSTFLKNIYSLLLERQIYRDKKRFIFPSTGSIPNGYNHQSWANPKSEASSFPLVSHVDVGA